MNAPDRAYFRRMRLVRLLGFAFVGTSAVLACAGNDGGLNSGILPLDSLPAPDASARDGAVSSSDGSQPTSDSGRPSECQPACGAEKVCSDGACVSTRCQKDADCASPKNGSALCGDGACVRSCDAGFHLCGASCKADDDPGACGAACTACATQTNATAACVTGVCKLACDQGFHDCSGTCSANTAVTSCGTSCSACPTTTNGAATCNGTSCGLTCDAGYVLSNKACVRDCAASGCGALEWCDTLSHTCKPGCGSSTQCPARQFCDRPIHDCVTTVIQQAWEDYPCPAGFDYMKSCGQTWDLCVNEWVPNSATYPIDTACPSGSSERGRFTCGASVTRVCVPN